LNSISLTPKTRSPLILMYHGTPNHDPSSIYSIRADLFNEHVCFLKKQGWHTALFRDLHNGSALPRKTVILTFDDGYADNYDGAFLPLMENNMRATWFITTDCIGKHSDMMGAPLPMLTAEQLRQMKKAGMEIGSHTCAHPDLRQLSYQQQQAEMIQSRQILETIIGGKISTFAYPYGHYNEDSITALNDADYQLACTTTIRPDGFNRKNHPFLFRRVPILANDSVTTLALKLAFAEGYYWYLPKMTYPEKKWARYFYRRIKDKWIGDRQATPE